MCNRVFPLFLFIFLFFQSFVGSLVRLAHFHSIEPVAHFILWLSKNWSNAKRSVLVRPCRMCSCIYYMLSRPLTAVFGLFVVCWINFALFSSFASVDLRWCRSKLCHLFRCLHTQSAFFFRSIRLFHSFAPKNVCIFSSQSVSFLLSFIGLLIRRFLLFLFVVISEQNVQKKI